ncbi:MAG: peptidase U32 family protein [Bacteroidota bacterium]|nr:peptidase U32 family protein [Bacteroidota bacterium]
MSPVGSYESLMAAIQGGADAVYFGIGHLNMRSASSKNFTLDDLKEITRICKENKVRTYITLNTVVYDEEIDEMKKVVDAAKENGISAIIASDLAVISYARQAGMEVHMSTQTNISNIEAVKFYAEFADVMVTARELSLDKVKAITRSIEKEQIKGPSGKLVQIEVFAHGALCMAISGKCYLSLDNLNHSANRGECLQICRRPYKVTDKDGDVELEVDNEYIMSPKDLKTIDFLDKILDAGVKVLKIEGRGRSPEYVKTVTGCYKEAVKAYFDGEYTQENIQKWNEKLKSVYNRGFWDGYYLGRKLGEWSERYGSQATKKKIYVGRVTNYYTKLQVAEVKMETQSLEVGDEIKIIGPTTGVVDEEVKEIRVDLKNVDRTVKGEVCSIPVEAFLRRSDKVYKVVELAG